MIALLVANYADYQACKYGLLKAGADPGKMTDLVTEVYSAEDFRGIPRDSYILFDPRWDRDKTDLAVQMIIEAGNRVAKDYRHWVALYEETLPYAAELVNTHD